MATFQLLVLLLLPVLAQSQVTVVCDQLGTKITVTIPMDTYTHYHVGSCGSQPLTNIAASFDSFIPCFSLDAPFSIFLNKIPNIETDDDDIHGHECNRDLDDITVQDEATIAMMTGTPTTDSTLLSPTGILKISIPGNTNTKISGTYVGQHITAYIILDENYRTTFAFRAAECFLYNLDHSNSEGLPLTDENGCDGSSVLDITSTQVTGPPYTAIIGLPAVKFKPTKSSGENHRIKCTLKICIRDLPSDCTLSCNEVRRKRQANEGNQNTEEDDISVEANVEVYSTKEQYDEARLSTNEEIDASSMCMNRNRLMAMIGVLAAGMVLSIAAACWLFLSSRRSRKQERDRKTLYTSSTSGVSTQHNLAFRA